MKKYLLAFFNILIIGVSGASGQVLQTNNTSGGVSLASSFAFDLNQNTPNPFLSSTNIKYSLKKTTGVVLKVYDILGKEVVTLVNQKQSAGVHNSIFYATGLTHGVYYYQIKVDDYIETRRMIISKE